jgi:uncharacterized protein
MTNENMKDFSRLVDWFLKNERPVIVALSGGVDSAVVALAAKAALGDDVLAVTANYNTLSEEELRSAKNVAKEIRVNHKVIYYNELENSRFVSNDKSRCYYCRIELSRHLLEEAEKSGARLIVDGTNIDDLFDVRPGIKAFRESGVKSPLIESGINKNQIRSIAQSFGLSVFNRASNSCLASRIPHGIKVTYQRLKKIENSEIIVKSLFNISQVRVRDHSDIARIEVPKEELAKMFDVDKLQLLDIQIKKLGFKFVAIDTAGYRPGSLALL